MSLLRSILRRSILGVPMVALAVAGCEGEGGDTGATGDDTAAPDACDEAPVVTYANFGQGFMTQHCQACHASTTPDRHGAPPAATFDTEEQVWALADRILVRSTGDAPTMPPQGGVADDDRYLLEVWLTCGAE